MGMVETQRMQKRSFDAPDEQRPAGTARADIVNLGNVTMMRVTRPARVALVERRQADRAD